MCIRDSIITSMAPTTLKKNTTAMNMSLQFLLNTWLYHSVRRARRASGPTNVAAHFEIITRHTETLIARQVCFAGAPL